MRLPARAETLPPSGIHGQKEKQRIVAFVQSIAEIADKKQPMHVRDDDRHMYPLPVLALLRARRLNRFSLGLLVIMLVWISSIDFKLKLLTWGMKCVVKGGFWKEKETSPLEATKLQANKSVLVDRTQRFWFYYGHLFSWISVCAFIITLGPDIWRLVTPERASGLLIFDKINVAHNDSVNAPNLQARPLLSSYRVEPKEEDHQGTKLASREKVVRLERCPLEHGSIVPLDEKGIVTLSQGGRKRHSNFGDSGGTLFFDD